MLFQLIPEQSILKMLKPRVMPDTLLLRELRRRMEFMLMRAERQGLIMVFTELRLLPPPARQQDILKRLALPEQLMVCMDLILRRLGMRGILRQQMPLVLIMVFIALQLLRPVTPDIFLEEKGYMSMMIFGLAQVLKV